MFGKAISYRICVVMFLA